MPTKTLLIALIMALAGLMASIVRADEPYTYIVQPGDTLSAIAGRYNLSITDITAANSITDANIIEVGQAIVLPGVVITTTEMPAPSPTPAEPSPAYEIERVHTVQSGETFFEIAQLYGLPLATLAATNSITNLDRLEVGQVLLVPGGTLVQPLPYPFEAITLSEPAIRQGRTLVVNVTLSEPQARLSGMFWGMPVMFQGGQSNFWGIAPIHALTEPRPHRLTLTATLASGEVFTATEPVFVVEGNFRTENLILDPNLDPLLDPDVIDQEREKVAALWSQFTPRPLWAGPFILPLTELPLRVTSQFGTRRTYNDDTVIAGYHTGIDFGSPVGTPIYAPANGTVIMAEGLAVRGKAILIDHGLGLFSGYWHLNDMVVNAGQSVQQGQLIGTIGNTGLSTGPHLHWEFRLRGIAVTPTQWTTQAIPN